MSEPKKTPLHDLHIEWGGKMTDFAGYALPLSYAGGGFIAEHLHTRQGASLFDVSHMGQVFVRGADAAAALSRLTPSDVSAVGEGNAKYALLTNAQGGVLDDFIVGNDGERGWFVVFNASRKQEDLAHLRAHLPSSCEIEELSDWGLFALQGPAAEAATVEVIPAVAELLFMQTLWFEFEGAMCRVARSGYTGEDGFEFSAPANKAEALARRLTSAENVHPAGLGARDSLRLEAGLCLYGNDLDETTTPVEAGLIWTIPKARRSGGDYQGAEVIARQIAEGPPRRLVGLRPVGRKIPRAGAPLENAEGGNIGVITSGVHSPSLGVAVAMGYVRADCVDGKIAARVRNDIIECEVAKPPFVQHQYRRKT